MQTVQTRSSPSKWISEPAKGGRQPSQDQPSATARLVPLEQGLYAVAIGETTCPEGELSGLALPALQLSAPPGGEQLCEFITAPGARDTWIGPEGGTVIVKVPAAGGHVLVTAFGHPGHVVPVPDIDIRRLDRSRSNRAAPGSAGTTEGLEEIRTEIVLHIERLGDRCFPGQGWVGNRGKRLRIEAFSIRPLDTLMARDIEFKAFGPKQRQTPWVTDAKLCGTRGRGMPLTGFAIRLAPHARERFDIFYEGAFFESGIVGPHRNGELCIPPTADDPLEAIQVRLTRRPAK